MYIDPDLPDALQGDQTRPKNSEDDAPDLDREELLNSLGAAVAAMRTEAVEARKTSGIEEVWLACEEAYLGIDEANRHEFAKAQWAKPTSMSGGLQRNLPPNGTRSTAFVRLTSRYVDMGAAKVSEITLPIDDKAFSLDATPLPDLVKDVGNSAPLLQEGKQVFRPLGQGEPPPLNLPQHGMVPATKGDLAKATLDQASDAAIKAEKRIYDWMLEANYPAEMRKVVFDAARLGAGVLKAPFPEQKTGMARINGAVKRQSRIVPGMRWVSLWNIYPHGACGEDIHGGDYIFEQDKLSPSKLRSLKNEMLPDGQPIYIRSQIDKVLKEGPNKIFSDNGNPSQTPNSNKNLQYTIWYFTGAVKREDMAVYGAVGLEDLPDDIQYVDAIVTLVNESVIRAAINPLKSGRFPYRVLRWSRRDGSWDGVGVGEQVSMPQRLINAATRALANNAGKSAGAQLVIDRTQIEPASGTTAADWVITPDKIWYKTADATSDDVRKIFMSVEFPNMGPQLMSIVDYAFRLAEEATNIPLVTQGKESEFSPETFGAAELQNSNAHTLLRAIATALDDAITEPTVTDLYEWLLLDDSIPEEEKGDFQINAKGSSAMVEKAIQEMVLAQLLPVSKDPAYGLNPRLLIEQYLRAKRLDPRRLQYTEEELAKMAQQPPPEDPRVTAAKISAEASVKVGAGRDQATVAKSQADTDRDALYTQAQTDRTEALSAAAERKLELQVQLAQLNYANQRNVGLDQVKKDLAINAMKLNVQRELSREAMQEDLHKHHNPSPKPPVMKPPTEPAGRAPAGQSFAR